MEPNKTSNENMNSRFRGCLLGGAVGDALGYPVEFQSEREIFSLFGREGIRCLREAGEPAVVSDDTQMTLFAASALLRAFSCPEGGEDPLLRAYQEWLGTQGDVRCLAGREPVTWFYEDPRLHHCRAPGNTCLSALRATEGKKRAFPARNASKGCGTVMRAAPFGLLPGDDPKEAERYAARDALLTHGHPLARASSAVLAKTVFETVRLDPGAERLETTVLRCAEGTEEELKKLLERAVTLAADPTVSDREGIRILGEGWVAEEALAIAVFCAVRHQDDFASAIRAAVNHGGDSDSTGAICGNLLGARLGEEAVAAAFDLRDLEMTDLLTETADDLYRLSSSGVPAPGTDPAWDRKYRRRDESSKEENNEGDIRI